MTGKDIIKDIMKLRKWSQAKLAQEAGYKGQSNVTGILNRYDSLNVSNMVKMVEAMGCEVIVRDKMGSGQEWKVEI